MPVNIKAKLIEKEEISKDIFRFKIHSKEVAEQAKAGQFLQIKCTEGMDLILRRPISIHEIDKENGNAEFIFQVKGKGTKILSEKSIDEEIDVLGPLGWGSFDIKDYKNVAIIGGGIGIFPLYELAKKSYEQSNVSTYLGFRSKEYLVLEEKFKKVSNKLVITTDDGSYGEKGFAINKLKEDNEKQKFDIIYACGPLPMLKAVRQYAIENNIPCQISLEERMACGIGACLGCAVKVISGKEERYGHVCKEGPVFWAKDVEI